MSKQRIKAIEYIRALAMMGVVAIHVGSQYIVYNQSANINLIAFYEILSRFSVPIFFFVSAFGLFYNLDNSKPFNFKKFLLRRGQAVAIPYIVWSFIYLLIYSIWQHNISFWYPDNIVKTLFFGLASYQLYFLVILIWFYIFMPLWIYIIPKLNIKHLILLFILQLLFNNFSTTILSHIQLNNILNPFIQFRLNYWVAHYLFIFILGGYLANNYNKFKNFMDYNLCKIRIGAFLSTIWILGYYYYCIFVWKYSPESAVNTAHQLSTPGLVYTLMISIWLFSEFRENNFSPFISRLLSIFAENSYFVYLVHPIVIYIAIYLMQYFNIVMTGIHSLLFFAFILISSTFIAIIIRNFSNKYAPFINRYTIGTK